MDYFTQMLTFVKVVEENGFAPAARLLGYTTAAVSKQISALEKKLGVELLFRTTRRVEPTDIGHTYYHQCLQILEEVQEAESIASHFRAEPSGTLKVVAARIFGEQYLLPHLEEFLTLYPKIRLNLELSERIPDPVQERIDIVIGMSVTPPGDLIQKRIMTTKYCICASPKYLKKHGTPKTPKDLKAHRYITHSSRKPDDKLTFRNEETITIQPYVRLNDSKAMYLMACQDVGIVKLHEYVVRHAIENGKLVEVLSDSLREEIPMYVAYPRRRYLPGKVRKFIDFVVSKLRTQE